MADKKSTPVILPRFTPSQNEAADEPATPHGWLKLTPFVVFAMIAIPLLAALLLLFPAISDALFALMNP
jgi:hypothetical protein